MSDLIVKVTEITDKKLHPNADKLAIFVVDGWQIVGNKDALSQGDQVIFVPPDSMVPWELAEKWGVDKYLAGYDKRFVSGNQYEKAGKVKAVRLRGEISLGFVVPNEDNLSLGEIVNDYYGIFKWEPPEDNSLISLGLAEKSHPLLFRYTDIQNERNFTNVFIEGEEVVATEKIHGSSSTISATYSREGTEDEGYELMISSRKIRRKLGQGSIYEKPLDIYPGIQEMLFYLADETGSKSVEIFGEVFGWIQDLRYGHGENQISYRAFDIALDNEYLNYDDFVSICDKFEILRVPEIYRGPFNKEKLWGCSSGKTLIPMDNPHIREGIVVKPVIERKDPKLGRVILKMVSDDYLTRKDGTEYH